MKKLIIDQNFNLFLMHTVALHRLSKHLNYPNLMLLVQEEDTCSVVPVNIVGGGKHGQY